MIKIDLFWGLIGLVILFGLLYKFWPIVLIIALIWLAVKKQQAKENEALQKEQEAIEQEQRRKREEAAEKRRQEEKEFWEQHVKTKVNADQDVIALLYKELDHAGGFQEHPKFEGLTNSDIKNFKAIDEKVWELPPIYCDEPYLLDNDLYARFYFGEEQRDYLIATVNDEYINFGLHEVYVYGGKYKYLHINMYGSETVQQTQAAYTVEVTFKQ